MFIKNLTLNNFKNFEHLELSFNKINGIVGNNGVGKTNILDAIYYLSFCKSFFGSNSVEPIRYGEDFFSIKGVYSFADTEETFVLSQKKGQRKVLKHDNQPYKRFIDHIGKIPCVIVCPSDQEYISGHSEIRRRFMDAILCQTDVVYLDNLMTYNKCLEQRNRLLKFMQQSGVFDTIQLDVWNERLQACSNIIRSKRKAFFDSFKEPFQRYYSFICDNKEDVDIEYSTYEGDLIDLLHQKYEKEKVLGYTTVGIHRDDLQFFLKGHNVNYRASQGQQKTFVLAMKMAQFAYLKQRKQTTPILLLDDIFDKFDFFRVEKILTLVGQDAFNQVFLTDTHPDRVERFLYPNFANNSTITRL